MATVNLLLACFLLSMIGSLSWAEDNYNQNAEQNEKCETSRVVNESTGAVHVITRCVVQESSPYESVVAKDADKEDEKDSHEGVKSLVEKDLEAQESMANSTEWIMLFTLGGLVIGAIGLYYLRNTVLHSHNASKYAHETLNVARDAQRAILKPKGLARHVASGPPENRTYPVQRSITVASVHP